MADMEKRIIEDQEAVNNLLALQTNSDSL